MRQRIKVPFKISHYKKSCVFTTISEIIRTNKKNVNSQSCHVCSATVYAMCPMVKCFLFCRTWRCFSYIGASVGKVAEWTECQSQAWIKEEGDADETTTTNG